MPRWASCLDHPAPGKKKGVGVDGDAVLGEGCVCVCVYVFEAFQDGKQGFGDSQNDFMGRIW